MPVYGKPKQRSVYSGPNMTRLNPIKDRAFNLTVLGLYGLAVAVGFMSHEMWRDEYEQLLFRRYNGFVDDGSPFYVLYNFLCWGVLQLHDSVPSFKALHLVFALGISALVLWCSPFQRWQKCAIIFSYFLLYEYTIISRYYGLIVLMMFSVTALLSVKSIPYFSLALLMILGASINPISAAFVAAFAFYVGTLWYFGELPLESRKQKVSFYAGLVFFLGGFLSILALFFLYVMAPDGLKPFASPRPPLISIVSQVWNAYIPVPDISQGINYWWTNIFPQPVIYPKEYSPSFLDLTRVSFLVPTVASIAMLVVVSWKIRGDKPVLFFFLVSTCLQLALIYFALKAYVIRYLGVLFVTLLISLWLYETRKSSKAVQKKGKVEDSINPRHPLFLSMAFKPTLAFILLAQVFAGAWAYVMDLKSRFSNSVALSEFVKNTRLHQTHTLVGFMDCHTQGIIAENRVPMYFPQISGFGRFAEQYNTERKTSVSFEDLVAQIENLLSSQNKPVALILTNPISDPAGNQLGSTGTLLNNNLQIRLLYKIDQPVICRDEVFWVYEVNQR